MKRGATILVLALAVCATGGMALAQKKVAGEKWRQNVSMQMEGFSMPSRTVEICAPAEGIEETMARPQGQDNCAISNVTRSGNRFSADVKCSGKDPVEGRIEMQNLGDTVRGTMDMKSGGQAMRMTMETTRLGQACEVQDYSSYQPPVVVQAAPQFDLCQNAHDDTSGGDLHNRAMVLFATKSVDMQTGAVGDCRGHAVFRQYCADVQTPAGFANLDRAQHHADKPPAFDPSVEQLVQAPLTESLKACGLDGSARGIAALQAKMVTEAERTDRWSFLLYYAPETWYPQLAAMAKTHCSGRSFTNASNAKYAALCRNYGAALARDDRGQALGVAGCSAEREDRERGICIGATGATGASASVDDAAAADGSRTTGSADVDAGADDNKESTTDKARDAVEKGRRALRGLFGGG